MIIYKKSIQATSPGDNFQGYRLVPKSTSQWEICNKNTLDIYKDIWERFH